jgi:hypothetical protein
MITTMPPTTGQAPYVGTIQERTAPGTGPTGVVVPVTRDRPWLPYLIGGLLGLLVILACAAWAFLVLTSGDYSGVIDVSQVIQP